jgi:hypothetical protein
MNEFTRKAMELADALEDAARWNLVYGEKPVGAARSALLAHLEGADSPLISHSETVSTPGAALKVDVFHLTEEGKRAISCLPATPTEEQP